MINAPKDLTPISPQAEPEEGTEGGIPEWVPATKVLVASGTKRQGLALGHCSVHNSRCDPTSTVWSFTNEKPLHSAEGGKGFRVFDLWVVRLISIILTLTSTE